MDLDEMRRRDDERWNKILSILSDLDKKVAVNTERLYVLSKWKETLDQLCKANAKAELNLIEYKCKARNLFDTQAKQDEYQDALEAIKNLKWGFRVSMAMALLAIGAWIRKFF